MFQKSGMILAIFTFTLFINTTNVFQLNALVIQTKEGLLKNIKVKFSGIFDPGLVFLNLDQGFTNIGNR